MSSRMKHQKRTTVRKRKGCRGDDCGKQAKKNMPLSYYVSHYIKHYREKQYERMSEFTSGMSFEELVRIAACGLRPKSEKMDAHQRRLGRKVCKEGWIKLSKKMRELRKARSFEELHHIVWGSTRGGGRSDLYVYDVALRIAFRNPNLLPEKVYLHRKTLAGAKGIPLANAKDIDGALVVDRRNITKALRSLQSWEVEDFLCIYNERLNGRKRRKRK